MAIYTAPGQCSNLPVGQVNIATTISLFSRTLILVNPMTHQLKLQQLIEMSPQLVFSFYPSSRRIFWDLRRRLGSSLAVMMRYFSFVLCFGLGIFISELGRSDRWWDTLQQGPATNMNRFVWLRFASKTKDKRFR